MTKGEEFTLDDEIEVSRLLSEYLRIMEQFPLVRDEYWKRRNIIQKYQRHISKCIHDEVNPPNP